MTYVDLNPIRAGIAETPETSDYTSIQERIGGVSVASESEAQEKINVEKTAVSAVPIKLHDETILQPEPAIDALPPATLMPFDVSGQIPWAIPFAFNDYLELVDWTGRAVHPLKRGAIPSHHPAILKRLGIDGHQFIRYADRFLKNFGTAVGAPSAMIDLCARRQSKFLRGITASNKIFAMDRQAA